MAFLLNLQKRHLAMAGMALAMLIYGSNFVISRHAVSTGCPRMTCWPCVSLSPG